jgi:hypothetical protein
MDLVGFSRLIDRFAQIREVSLGGLNNHIKEAGLANQAGWVEWILELLSIGVHILKMLFFSSSAL